jgi:Tfp pilus assembly protein FimT
MSRPDSKRCRPIIRAASGPVLRRLGSDAGWSLIDILVAVSVAAIMTAIAVPQVQNVVRNYHLNAAVSSVTGAIQSTRYQAIMRGYPYAIQFDATSGSYQVLNKPPGATGFVATGGPTPISGLDNATLSVAASFQFNPQGTVVPTNGGGSSVQISNGSVTKTITVSAVGQVQVTP